MYEDGIRKLLLDNLPLALPVGGTLRPIGNQIEIAISQILTLLSQGEKPPEVVNKSYVCSICDNEDCTGCGGNAYSAGAQAQRDADLIWHNAKLAEERHRV